MEFEEVFLLNGNAQTNKADLQQFDRNVITLTQSIKVCFIRETEGFESYFAKTLASVKVGPNLRVIRQEYGQSNQ